MSTEKNTEEKILEAAEKVFHDKGFYGARMREIAEKAGINKGLLHYYFKTKHKLFEAIFNVAKNRMISKIQGILEKDMPLQEKVEQIVDGYLDMLIKHPNLPQFVLNELNSNPDQFVGKHFNHSIKDTFSRLQDAIEQEVRAGKIQPIDARQLIMNLMSMIVFPFAGRPILQNLLAMDNTTYFAIMEERKTHIKAFVRNALRP